MRLSLGLAAGLAAAAVACGPNAAETEGTTGDAPAELQIHEFFIAAEEAYCGWAATCGGYEDAQACHATEFFDEWFQTDLLASGVFSPGGVRGTAVKYLLAAHDAGRIVFDGKAAADCLAYVKSRGCDRPGTYVAGEDELAGRAACEAIFHGTMVRNGPCYTGIECAAEDGAEVVCGLDPTCMDACCVGGCRVLSGVPEGTPCTSQTRCEAGTYCAFDFNAGAFTVCSKQLDVGASCPFGNECKAGTYCDFFDTLQCRALGELGDPCWDQTCVPGLYCGDKFGNGDRRCLEYVGEGEACGSSVVGCRALDNVCSQTCVKLPKVGQACVENSYCAPTATCNYDWMTDTSECRPRAGVDEACGERYDENTGFYEVVNCLGGLVCDGFDLNTSRCHVPGVASVCPVPELEALPSAM